MEKKTRVTFWVTLELLDVCVFSVGDTLIPSDAFNVLLQHSAEEEAWLLIIPEN